MRDTAHPFDWRKYENCFTLAHKKNRRLQNDGFCFSMTESVIRIIPFPLLRRQSPYRQGSAAILHSR